jgi:hypothetical protein
MAVGNEIRWRRHVKLDSTAQTTTPDLISFIHRATSIGDRLHPIPLMLRHASSKYLALYDFVSWFTTDHSFPGE